MPILCQHEGMAAPTRARAGSQLGTDPPPLFDFSVRTYVHTVGINHGQSGNMETAAVRLYFLLKHYYSLVILLHIIWIDVNSCTRNKFQQRQLCARVMHFSAFHFFLQ